MIVIRSVMSTLVVASIFPLVFMMLLVLPTLPFNQNNCGVVQAWLTIPTNLRVPQSAFHIQQQLLLYQQPASTTDSRQRRRTTTTTTTRTTVLYMAQNRKARRMQKVEKSRPEQFYDSIADAEDKAIKPKLPKLDKEDIMVGEQEEQVMGSSTGGAGGMMSPTEEARRKEIQARMDQRPVVSTMLIDEQSGMEVVQQGKAVMDVVTRQPVQLSTLGSSYRLAQMFPGVPPNIRQQYRIPVEQWKSTSQSIIPELVQQLMDVCMVITTTKDSTITHRRIPVHPSIANKAIDYVLANRDLLGPKMKRTLGRLTLRAASMGNTTQAQLYRQLWKHFYTIENYISGPFRQMIMDGEGRIGPNFGNLNQLNQYADGDLYERCANYLVLKGMVAHWEKKVIDAEYIERTPMNKNNYMRVLARGDPKRYLPDPPILFTLKECTQVCYMSQQMTKAFVEESKLFDDLPVEIRFLEQALTIQGGTALRKFMITEFCPKEQITPDALREGMKRLQIQLDNLQIDPYGDLTNVVERLYIAMAVGSDDEYDPYRPYLANLDSNGPGAFQTYTTDADELSLVRFLDSQYERQGVSAGGTSSSSFSSSSSPMSMGGMGSLFGFGGGIRSTPATPLVEPTYPTTTTTNNDGKSTYKVPAARAAGRPHELGWLELLKDNDEEGSYRLGMVPPGRIIPDN